MDILRPLISASRRSGRRVGWMRGRAACRLLWPTLAGFLAVVAVPMSATAASQGMSASSPVPVLHWRSCDGGFQCATAQVPLDYRHPDGATVGITVIELPATDPAHPAGTLFMNTGGPGPQIESFAAGGGAGLPAPLRQFNIVTFDERGFGQSSPIQCFPNAGAENKLLAALPTGFPVGARQDATWEKTWARFDAVCARNGGSLLQHDTSTDAARDMNLIRQAVGAPKIDYLGVSYGTGLGAIYANLFPATVGHMILDGNLDPASWSASGSLLPDALREGADLATAAVTRSFLDLCGQATTATCAFSAGTPAATRVKYATLLRGLRRHPVTLGTPPQTFTYADAISDFAGGVDIVSDWQSTSELLQQLWAASAAGPGPAARGAAAPSTVSHPATAPNSAYAGQEQGLAQQCADVADPRSTRTWEAAARLAAARSGGLGLGFTWAEESCAAWPAGASNDRYTGPWNHPTASPILVIGNTGDPITPYSASVAMSRELGRARLLTINEFGHTELNNPDTCAENYEISYLVSGALPPAGTVCQQNTPPFHQASQG